MLTPDFIEGFEKAVTELGREGDYRNADWSAPHAFLSEQLEELKEEAGYDESVGGTRKQIDDVIAKLRGGTVEDNMRADTIQRVAELAGV